MDESATNSEINGCEEDATVVKDQVLVTRPPFQLRSLPIECRWEATRRHPYYQHAWKPAKAHHQGAKYSLPFEQLLAELAVVLLSAIGVSGDPPDPANSFETLAGPDLNCGWLSGAVHPITLRGMAGLLIAALSAETLQHLGKTFQSAASGESTDSHHSKMEALQSLTIATNAELDCYLDEPFVSINPAASKRQISDAIDVLLDQWKKERTLSEQRDRSDKYDVYFETWDLREGWHEGRYDRTRELTLKEIASRLSRSIPTISNQYRRAFQLITGHDYSPELYLQLFGPLKLAELFGGEPARTSLHRPMKSRARVAVPASKLAGNKDGSTNDIVTGLAVNGTGPETRELVNDIRSLIGKGLSNEQIAKSLDLTMGAIDAIEYLRHRDPELF